MTITTTDSPPLRRLSSAGVRLGSRQAAVAAVAVTLVAEALLALVIADPRLNVLLLAPAAVVVLALFLRWPLLGVTALLVLTDSAFHESFFAIEAGALSIRLHEIVLLGVLFVALVRPRRATWGGTAGGALAIFFGLLALSAALALSVGRVEPTDVVNWGRPFVLLSLFYVGVRLFPDARSAHRVLVVAAVIASVTGLVALVAALHQGVGELLQDPGRQFIRAQEGLGLISRVRLPGLGLAYGLFWFAVVQLGQARGTRRLLWAGVLAGQALNLAISFNRNMWVGLLVGLGLLLVLSRGQVRYTLARGVAVGAAGIALMAFLAPTAPQGSRVTPLIDRAATLGNLQAVGESSSADDRRYEIERGWATALDHPVIGVGVGAPYGAHIADFTVEDRYVRLPRRFLHNQYLYLVLVAGVPGLIAFLVFLGKTLRLAWRRNERDPSMAACGVGLATIMLSSVVMLYFSVPDMTAAIGVISGAIVASTARSAAPETAWRRDGHDSP